MLPLGDASSCRFSLHKREEQLNSLTDFPVAVRPKRTKELKKETF